MKGPAHLLLAAAVLVGAANTSSGQVTLRPTPAPVVTAENETWLRTGEPLAFAGNLYYPAGAAIHFLANEMVRTGSFRGVPLYSRTTIEPFSVIFVPIGGGLMQPYERRRDFDLAGTQGSSAPALSPALASSVSPTTAASPYGAPSPAMAQAPAPPVVGAPLIVDEPVAAAAGISPAAAPAISGTSQPVATTGLSNAPPPPIRVRPGAANAIYVEFNNARWFSARTPASVDVRSLTQVGELQGFPVYATGPGASTIFVQSVRGVDTYAQYSRRR